MTVLKLKGHIDDQHRLLATVPDTIAAGPVEIVVVLTSTDHDEDDAGQQWAAGVAREWAAEPSDPREDIYSLTDGRAADAAG